MKRLLLLLVVLLSVSCQHVERPEKPEDLIPEDKMVEVLTESYLANAARGVGTKNILVKNVKMDSLIYHKFNIDSAQFAKSNAYYAADVNKYIAIFERVEAKLNAMDKKLDSIRDNGGFGNPNVVDMQQEAKSESSQ